jgi:site-specific recombinase XerD
MDRNESLTKFESYLQRRFPERRTSIDYVSDVRQFMAVCPKPWREVTMQDIDLFVDQQRQAGLKQSTVNRRVAALKTFFDFLAEESGDLSWPNPVRFKRHAGKRPRALPRDVRDEDIERLWDVIVSARDRAWFALMVRAGLRVGEVVNLKVSDLLSPAEGERPARLRVCGKGGKERVVWLSADAYAVLENWLQVRPASEDPHVFLNGRGKGLSANGLQWLLHQYGQQVGLDLTPHQLRHTFARQLTEVGMPLTSLGKLLGHAQITTTQIYTAGADPELAQAYQIAMSRLGEPSPRPPSPPPVAPAIVTASPEPVVPPSSAERVETRLLPLPDWDTWATHLPAAIRQASLEYVQRRLPTWSAPRRRHRAQSVLNELTHLWGWFLAHRLLTRPGELNLKDLWAYQTDQQAQGYAAGTINRRLDYILGILRELADRDEPVDNSVFRLRALPRPASLPRHLTEEESQRLEAFLCARLTSPDPKVRLENACLFVLLHSGLRKSECVDLRFQDLDLAGKRLIVRQGKGQRDRLVYLSDITCQAIQGYLQDAVRRPTDPVWLYPNGKPMSAQWLRDHVSAIGQAVGIEHLYPHRLRHTCATRLLNAGMDIARIQKLLGHEQISTTMIYARVQDATVEADYRRALSRIERQQMPLSNQPITVTNWPTQIVKMQDQLDNSV